MAGDTGGKALFDTNDLDHGIVQAQQAISDYYTLGYYATNTAKNGHFRRIKVSLTQELDANLTYRQGYYADKEFSNFTTADKERQLEDALMLEDPITDLSIAMEIDYFQLNRAEYFVPIIVKIPGRELALAKRGGAEHTLIDFVGEIKDLVGGTTVSNVRDNVNIKLSDATAAELAHRPIEYDTGFTLLPGKYRIKFLARDDETGRIGTYQTTFVIPNLNKEDKRVPISSVVLSSQRVELNEALYDATQGKEKEKEAAVNPLVHAILQNLVGTQVALGVIPLGTANALASNLGLLGSPAKVAAMLLHAMPVRVPVGRIHFHDSAGNPASRSFLVAAGVGADALLMSRMDARLKRRLGYILYLIEAFRVWAGGSFPLFEAAFTANGSDAPRLIQVSQLLVVRVRSFGGALRELAPGATLHSPRLNMLAFRTQSRRRFMRFLLAVLFRRHTFNGDIELLEAASVQCHALNGSTASVFVEADGEVLGSLPVRIEVVPDALTLLIPPNAQP
jgi:diacylglycerol kinase family enzyme